MKKRPGEVPLVQPKDETPANRAQRLSRDEGELRRREYVSTLDPRQRADLDPDYR